MREEMKQALGRVLLSPALVSELESLGSALSGDIVASRSAGQTLAATSAVWSKTFDVTIQDAAGRVMSWYNATHTSKVTVGDTSAAGAATVNSANITFVHGRAKITISGNAAAWLATETATITLANLTINGVTVTGGTMVVTVTA